MNNDRSDRRTRYSAFADHVSAIKEVDDECAICRFFFGGFFS
jgi:hypothetical protein